MLTDTGYKGKLLWSSEKKAEMKNKINRFLPLAINDAPTEELRRMFSNQLSQMIMEACVGRQHVACFTALDRIIMHPSTKPHSSSQWKLKPLLRVTSVPPRDAGALADLCTSAKTSVAATAECSPVYRMWEAAQWGSQRAQAPWMHRPSFNPVPPSIMASALS